MKLITTDKISAPPHRGRHHAKHTKWTNGVLDVVNMFFADLESAIAWAKTAGHGSVKIYNEYNELVHEQEQQLVHLGQLYA